MAPRPLLSLAYRSVLGAAVLWAGANAAIGGEANAATKAFANNCFSPFLTATRARTRIGATGARFDFYDLDPFSNVDPSPARGRALTQGTDRRCEVSFDGDFSALAVQAAVDGLAAEGINTPAPVPASFAEADGTALLAARQLNPARVAVVHVGTRQGPKGIETYLLVERLLRGETQ